MDTVFHNLLSSLSIRIITHEKEYLNPVRLGNGCHYFGMLIEGSAHFNCSYCDFDLQKGEIVYIPRGLPYTSHWFSGKHDKQVQFYSIGFNFLEPEKCEHYLLQKLEPSETLSNLITDMYHNKNIFFAVGQFYKFYQNAADIMYRSRNNTKNLTTAPAIRYLHEHCCEDISIPQLARLCSLSESYFYPTFKKENDCTPVQYKNRLKCQLAIELLQNSNHTLDYISDKLHFSSPAFMRKILKQETGKTPKEIRKQQTSL